MWDTAGREGQTHKWCSPIDPFTGTCQCWLINENYLQQLCAYIGCCLENLPGAMDEREEEREVGKSMLAVPLDDEKS